MYFTGLMDLTGQFEDTLGGGGFTGIHMGENTDISIMG